MIGFISIVDRGDQIIHLAETIVSDVNREGGSLNSFIGIGVNASTTGRVCGTIERRRAVTFGGNCCGPGVERVGEARRPGPMDDGMSITTGNGAGLGTILDWLAERRGHVVCAQERKVMDPTDVVYEKNRALAEGWKSMWSPSRPVWDRGE